MFTILNMSNRLEMLVAETPTGEEHMSHNRITHNVVAKDKPSRADRRLAKLIEIIVNQYNGDTSAYFAHIQAGRRKVDNEEEDLERRTCIADRFAKSF
jgi:hypothetical protein